MRRENYVAKQQRIGERLSRAMARARIDHRQLAERTGYSEQQIVRWEKGRAPLLNRSLVRLLRPGANVLQDVSSVEVRKEFC